MKERTVFATARKIRTNVRRRRRGEDESQKRKSVGSGKLRLRFKLLTSYFAEPLPLSRSCSVYPGGPLLLISPRRQPLRNHSSARNDSLPLSHFISIPSQLAFAIDGYASPSPLSKYNRDQLFEQPVTQLVYTDRAPPPPSIFSPIIAPRSNVENFCKLTIDHFQRKWVDGSSY